MDAIRDLAGRENARLSHLGKLMFGLFLYFDLPLIVDVSGYIVIFSIITLMVIKLWSFRNQPSAYMAKRCQRHHLVFGSLFVLAVTTLIIWLAFALILPHPETNASSVLPSSLRQLRRDSDTTITFAKTELAYLHGTAAAFAYTCLVAACRVPGSPIAWRWDKIQDRMQSKSSPLGWNVSQLDGRCWEADDGSFMQSKVHSNLESNFREEALNLGDMLSRYACDTIDLEKAIDVTINSTIIGSLDEIRKLLNTTLSAKPGSLDRLVAFYSSASPTNILLRRFYAKSLPIYTQLRSFFFPKPTVTELLSSKLLDMIGKVHTNNNIQNCVAIVKKTHRELDSDLEAIIRNYPSENTQISPDILVQFPPMRDLLSHIRTGSTQALVTILVSDSSNITKISTSAIKEWWAEYLEEVIFKRIFVQLERIGRRVKEAKQQGKFINGSELVRWLEGKEPMPGVG
ncbi:hypothetical protein HII31_02694 [Pseudocercospora fuligena]|uniref:Uncharacterized protein n=1 Tax=Pseudocercospora fuligena TaxID=685502 RepID=A0A8H6RRH0_9PEZI|nr:hypothetical protein HII31_02694 [Pseudocercospora fuligena]